MTSLQKQFPKGKPKIMDKDILQPEDELTLIELDGEQYEIIDAVIYDERSYIAVLPYSEEDSGDDDGESEFTILEMLDDPEDEENCILKTIDDDDLYTKVGDEFLKRFDSLEEFDDGE